MPSSPYRAPASRSDLLQVQSGSAVVPADPEATLAQMGFRISQPLPEHWVVTGVDPLPELHFYSRVELGRFALNQAKHYQQWLNWRQRHDKTADLSG